jgi:ABC-type transport system involved in multi-copper enzyme maturation permease subunit
VGLLGSNGAGKSTLMRIICTLIGLPIYVIAVGLGVRIIAGEIEQHTLEVTYTVPGGAQRFWLSKLFAAMLPIVFSGALLAIIAAIFFTEYPIIVLYGSLQGAVVYLVLAMGLGALLRSELTAVLVVGVVLLVIALYALACVRAERGEELLRAYRCKSRQKRDMCHALAIKKILREPTS